MDEGSVQGVFVQDFIYYLSSEYVIRGRIKQMGCEGGEHLWTARFFRSGSLAFWFCQSCGETDREIEQLNEPLEDISGYPDDFPMVVIRGETPSVQEKKWQLADGSVLVQGEPGSVEFRGFPIPGLPDSHCYVLTIAQTGEKREYTPRYERSSTMEDCFILTRYRIENSKLVKYRIHCCDYSDHRSVRIDEPNGNTILSGLEPVL